MRSEPPYPWTRHTYVAKRTLPPSHHGHTTPHHTAHNTKPLVTHIPGVLEAVTLLAPRGLDVAAVAWAVVGAPQRPPGLLVGVAVDGLPVAAGLLAVAVQDVHHPRRTVLAAEPRRGCFFFAARPPARRKCIYKYFVQYHATALRNTIFSAESALFWGRSVPTLRLPCFLIKKTG